MTPDEYFKLHPEACSTAQRLYSHFKSMREAWLHPETRIADMVWAVCKLRDTAENAEPYNTFTRLVQTLAEEIAPTNDFISRTIKSYLPLPRTQLELFATVVDPISMYLSASDNAGDVAMQQMRERLHGLFPDMFLPIKSNEEKPDENL